MATKRRGSKGGGRITQYDGQGIVIPVEVDSSGVEGDLEEAGNRIHAGLHNAKNAVELFKDALGLARTTIRALVGGIQEGIKTSREYERALAQVTTLTNENVTSTAMLDREMKRLAATYGGPAKDQAKALYETISAGIEDAADATKILDTANKLAIGGVTDVKTAVDGLTSVINAYGLS